MQTIVYDLQDDEPPILFFLHLNYAVYRLSVVAVYYFNIHTNKQDSNICKQIYITYKITNLSLFYFDPLSYRWMSAVYRFSAVAVYYFNIQTNKQHSNIYKQLNITNKITNLPLFPFYTLFHRWTCYLPI